MAYRKASEENPVVALGSEDFWAAVQNGGDVRISVGDILVWLRTVLQIEDVNELQAALDAIGATAHQELQDALGTLGGSVSDSLDALQADVDTRATKQELTTALGGLDGSVKTKLDTLTADVAAKDAKVRTDFAAADAKVKADLQAVINGLGTASARNAGNAAGQLPVLGADGKLDASTIPAVAITDTFPVATQAAMLASGAERGDIAIRTDLNRCYILQVEPATTLANWKELLTPTDAVLSVAGLTGAITAAGLKAALGIAIGDVAGLQAALTSIRTDFAAADTAIRTDFAAADATKLDKAGGTLTGQLIAPTPNVSMSQRADMDGSFLQVRSTGTGAAAMTFYRLGQYATWFGLDIDNEFKFGGWSEGTATHRFWTSKNFNPDTKASLNASVSFSALTVSARPTWAGLTPWDSGNFDPNTKANLAGAAFTGAVSSTGGFRAQVAGTGYSKLTEGSADRSGYVEFRHLDGTRHGYIGWGINGVIQLAAENGYRYDFNVAPTIVGATIHTSANFNPATKADLAGAGFTGEISSPGITATGGNGHISLRSRDGGKGALLYNAGSLLRIYDTAGADRVRFTLTNGAIWTEQLGDLNTRIEDRAYAHAIAQANDRLAVARGEYANHAKLSGGTFTGNITAPTIYATGGVVVGSGQTSSTLTMVDTDEGNRFVHNNSGTIGFLGSDGGWKFRVWDSGAVWTAQLGDLSTRIEDRSAAWARQESVARANERVAKTGDTMTGDLTVSKAYPTYRFFYSGVRDMGWQLREDACMYLWDWSGNTWQMRVDTSGAIIARGSIYTGNGSASLATNGDIWGSAWGNRWLSVAMGDITNNANGRVARTGDTMSGDLRLQTGDPRIKIDRSGVGGFSFLIHSDNRLYIQKEAGWAFQNNVASFGADGSIWTNQLGDLNTRIEDRAYAWAADRASYRVAKTGDTMTGDLTIAREWPTLTLLWGGVYRWALRTANSAEFQVMNPDTDSIKFAVRPNGSLYSAQMGDVEQFIRAVVNNKSIRLAYAGDLSNDWNKDQSYAEPYGGGVLTSRYVVSNQFIVDSWKGGRWRYLQMSDAWGNWYTCGYV